MGRRFLVNKGLANMTEHEPEYIIEDDDFFSGGKSVGIKELAIEQYRRCLIEGSKEMDGGGYRKRIHNGEVIEVLAPNQREVFCNSIDMLWILVKPFYDICKDEKIIWISGYRLDNRFKVSVDTKTVYKLELIKIENK